MKLSQQEAKDLISNNLDNWEVIEDEIVQRHYDVYHELVCKHEGKFYRMHYLKRSIVQFVGRYGEPKLTEVFPVETIVYKTQEEIDKNK